MGDSRTTSQIIHDQKALGIQLTDRIAALEAELAAEKEKTKRLTDKCLEWLAGWNKQDEEITKLREAQREVTAYRRGKSKEFYEDE